MSFYDQKILVRNPDQDLPHFGDHLKRRIMKKTLVVGATALTLLFGGAGIANADTVEAPATTTTTLAQNAQEQEDDGGDNGLWGLAGLLGLLGLAGLKRRKDSDYPAAARGTAGPGTAPRA